VNAIGVAATKLYSYEIWYI